MSSKNNLAKKVYCTPFAELCEDRKVIILKLLKLDDFGKDQYARVPKHSFIFSKVLIAVLLIVALLLQIKLLVIISFVLMFLYVVISTKANPIILLYTHTLNRLIKSKEEMLDEKGVRFANLLGTVLLFICLIFLYFSYEPIGWGIVFIAAALKIAGSLGFCSGLKLYHCMSNKECCGFIKRK